MLLLNVKSTFFQTICPFVKTWGTYHDSLFSFTAFTLFLSVQVTSCFTVQTLVCFTKHALFLQSVYHRGATDIKRRSLCYRVFQKMCACTLPHLCGCTCLRGGDKGQLAFRRIKDCQFVSDGVGKSLNLRASAIHLCLVSGSAQDRCAQ